MSAESEFFLSSTSDVALYETLQIYHPDFSQTYYVVRNNTEGITATIEDLSVKTFEYYPMRIQFGSSGGDLDQSVSIDFGDLGEVLPTEIDRVISADGFETKPTLVYRSYRSDDLTESISGAINLEIKTMTFDGVSVKLEAGAPRLNLNKTGEVYRLDRFPCLRGLL